MRCNPHRLASSRIRFLALLLPLTILLAASPARGQQRQQGPPAPVPRLFTVTPPGGKVGTTFEIALSGADVEEAQALHFSHPGIKAELIDGGQATVSDPKKVVPAVAKFKVTVPADAPPGIHDVRLINRFGISNPRAFVVGDLTDVVEKESNNDVGDAQRVELNTTINGTIGSPTDVDYVIFAGKKGQRVVATCLTSSIDSRLPAALQLFSSDGTPVAFNRNYNGGDALLDHTLPADGDYYVRLYAFAYTLGGPELYYRLSLTTAPWIDAVFPSVVEPGKPAQLTVYGRNLPGGKPDPTAVIEDCVLEKVTVTVNVPKDPAGLQRLTYAGFVAPLSTGLDGFEYRLRNQAGSSNPFLLTFAQAPVAVDNDKNDTPETAQPITLPCEIAGRIEPKRDRDWYLFRLKKGEAISIEPYGDRLGSPLDLYVQIRNAESGQQVGEFDDNNEVMSQTQFYTRSQDPIRQRFVAPADGKYQLMVSSRESYVRASPRHLYRVRLTPEKPDFRLVVMPQANNGPDACVVREGGANYYTVFAWRQDGFTGEIELSVEGLPAGVTCPPQLVGTGVKQAALVLSAAKDAMPWTGPIRVKGTAVIDGQKVEREARAASITWPVQQQNAVTISRLDREVVLAVREQAPFNLTASVDKPTILHNDKAIVTVKLARLADDFKAPVQLTALNLPPTIQLQPVTIGDKGEATVTLGASTSVPPGTYTILLRGQAQVPYAKNPKAKPANVTVTQAVPVTLTVISRQVGTLSVEPNAPPIKPGETAEVTVKLTRQNNYAGEFKVHLVVSPESKGITAEPVTIPAGQSEAKLVVKVAPDAAGGPRKGLLIQAVTQIDPKTPITTEAKFSVSVMR